MVVAQVDDPQRRHVRDGRQLVVAEVRRANPALAERQVLRQGLTEAIHEPALELPAQADRVDGAPDVDGEHRSEHAHRAGLGIDGDLDRVRARAVVGCGRVEPRADLQPLTRGKGPRRVRHGSPAELLLQRLRRGERRAAVHRRDAAAADARVRRALGREPAHAHGQRIDAQRCRDDPLDQGVLPAALVPHAGPHLDGPIAVEAKRDRRAAAAHVAHAEREPDASPDGARRIGADLGRGAIEQRAKVWPVPWFAGRGRIAGAGDVAPSQLERREAELPRDEIEVRLRREDVLRLSGRAHVPAGHLIRVHGRRLVARRGHAIALERRHAALDQEPHRRLARGVRATVEQRMRLVRDDAAVGIDAGAEPDPRRMAGVRGRELVGVPRDRAHRVPGRLREVIEDELVGREALGAEVAADRPVVDDDPLAREPERRGHLIPQVERRLVRRDDAHAVALEPHDRGPRLERGLMDARRRELVLEDPRGVSERRVHVAMRLCDVALVVRVRHRGTLAAALEEAIRRGVGVQHRRVGAERVLHVEERRELLVLDSDQADRFLGDLARVGRDRGDPIADEQHAVPAEHRPVLQPAAEALAADVRAGEDRAHAREYPGAAGVDRRDARVRIRAPREGGLQRAGHVEVGGVLRRAGRLGLAVDAALRPVEQVQTVHRAATVARRQSANPASTLSACRAMRGWPSSPMRPRIAMSLDTRSSVGASPLTARSTNARTAPPIR